MDLCEAHGWLSIYYRYILLHTKVGRRAKKYLKKRGITDEMIEKFYIGFAPEESNMTVDFLKSKKYNIDQLIEGKMLNSFNNGDIVDPFRGRIVFPIHNYEGKAVAFGGRSMKKNDKIKYYNSPNYKIYKKKDNLFGFSISKQAIKKKRYAILFEGYFDVITAHQVGLENVVSSLGTALTIEQALLLKSITKNVVIAFDNDVAGNEASFKSAEVLRQVGCVVKIATLKEGQDPDDMLRKEGRKSFFHNVIMTSKRMEDSFIEYAKGKYDVKLPHESFLFVREVLDEL